MTQATTTTERSLERIYNDIGTALLISMVSIRERVVFAALVLQRIGRWLGGPEWKVDKRWLEVFNAKVRDEAGFQDLSFDFLTKEIDDLSHIVLSACQPDVFLNLPASGKTAWFEQRKDPERLGAELARVLRCAIEFGKDKRLEVNERVRRAVRDALRIIYCLEIMSEVARGDTYRHWRKRDELFHQAFETETDAARCFAGALGIIEVYLEQGVASAIGETFPPLDAATVLSRVREFYHDGEWRAEFRQSSSV